LVVDDDALVIIIMGINIFIKAADIQEVWKNLEKVAFEQEVDIKE